MINIWHSDPEHSQFRFSVKNMAVATIRGRFSEFTVLVKSESDTFINPSIEVKISTSSLTTDNLERDAHLQGTDFFDVANFPTMEFKGKSLVALSETDYELAGMLTIKDVSKEIRLNVEYGGIAHGFDGEKRAGFSLTGKINRFDFGLSWNNLLDNAVPIVGADVQISIDIELVHQEN